MAEAKGASSGAASSSAKAAPSASAAGGPPALNKDVKPILEMFSTQIQHPNLKSVLANWRDFLAKGMLNFGRKETLSDDLEFNLLVVTNLNPSPNKAGTRVVLDMTTDFAGVITSKRIAHERFRYLKNEMIVVEAQGKWDYASNKGFRKMKINPKVNLRLPTTIEKDIAANGEKYIREASRLCFTWLVTNRLQKGQ